MDTERFNYLDKQLSFSRFAGTQALQVIKNITYLLDCHAGVAGSSPVRSTYIPLGEVHRLANPGSYLGEDDIVRFEDTYERAQS
jgi:hypothetical protein